MAGIWAALSASVRSLLSTHPLAMIVTVMFAEELGIPSPLPSDFLMLLAGVRVREGVLPLVAALLAQEAATVAGATGLFLISRRVGRGLVLRYGWLLHLGPAALAQAEAALQRSGGRAVVLGRLIPGLRIITPIAAGIGGVPLRTFVPALALGGFLYLLALNLAGMLFGPVALALFTTVALPTGALVSLGALAVAAVLLHSVRRETALFVRGTQGAAVTSRLDGGLAGVAALLATNGLVGLGAFLLRLAGHPVPLDTAELGTGLRLLLGGPVFLVAASLLGAVDERLGAERLPTIPRLALTAGAPLAVTLALAVPLAAGGLVHFASGRGEGLIAAEVVRWGTFGLALGQLLPADAALHAVPPPAGG
jgi:membrane protein DedA with SNARE-associated domain